MGHKPPEVIRLNGIFMAIRYCSKETMCGYSLKSHCSRCETPSLMWFNSNLSFGYRLVSHLSIDIYSKSISSSGFTIMIISGTIRVAYIL